MSDWPISIFHHSWGTACVVTQQQGSQVLFCFYYLAIWAKQIRINAWWQHGTGKLQGWISDWQWSLWACQPRNRSTRQNCQHCRSEIVEVPTVPGESLRFAQAIAGHSLVSFASTTVSFQYESPKTKFPNLNQGNVGKSHRHLLEHWDAILQRHSLQHPFLFAHHQSLASPQVQATRWAHTRALVAGANDAIDVLWPWSGNVCAVNNQLYLPQVCLWKWPQSLCCAQKRPPARKTAKCIRSSVDWWTFNKNRSMRVVCKKRFVMIHQFLAQKYHLSISFPATQIQTRPWLPQNNRLQLEAGGPYPWRQRSLSPEVWA